MTRIKVGDVYRIPLSENRSAYCQYMLRDRCGPMIRVFDLILNEEEDLDFVRLNVKKLLFPPIIVGLSAAVHKLDWERVGSLPIEKFKYPCFVSSYYHLVTGKAYKWFLWKADKETYIGNKLPRKYRKCEYMMGWSPQDVVRRIETGWYPQEYRDLMDINQFTPS